MSGAKLRLMCLVWPDNKPDEHIVEVKIDDDDTVAALKESIKAKHAPMLDKVAARDLVLWKCSLSANDKLQETLNTVVTMTPILVFVAYLPPPRFPSFS